MVRGERERGELDQEAGRQFWHDATTRVDARRDCRRLWMRKRRIDPLYNVKQQAVYLRYLVLHQFVFYTTVSST